MPSSKPLDRARVYTWAEAVRLVQQDPRYSVDDPYTGLEVIGWLWRPKPGSWRWTFTTNLMGRSYVVTAHFMPVYAEMRTNATS